MWRTSAGRLHVNDVSQLTFSVPFASLFDRRGSMLVPGTEVFQNIEHETLVLKEDLLVRAEVGCRLEGDVEDMGVEWQPWFTGHITGFEMPRSPQSGDRLKVTCADFMHLTKEAFVLNYPDHADYWAAGYGYSKR